MTWFPTLSPTEDERMGHGVWWYPTLSPKKGESMGQGS
jgi:hypothetical protein